MSISIGPTTADDVDDIAVRLPSNGDAWPHSAI
jgi:hypothetical protein